MGKLKDNNYTTIQGWMRTKLNLKGNELLAYAVVYGFSQDGESEYSGSIPYMEEWTGMSRRTVIDTLKSLCEKNLITKEEVVINNVKRCKYKAIPIGSANIAPVQKSHQVVQKIHQGSAEIAPLNKKDINKQNKYSQRTRKRDFGFEQRTYDFEALEGALTDY